MHEDARVTEELEYIDRAVLEVVSRGYYDNLTLEELHSVKSAVENLRLQLGPLFYQYVQLGSLKARADELSSLTNTNTDSEDTTQL